MNAAPVTTTEFILACLGLTIFLVTCVAGIKVAYFLLDFYLIEKPRREKERKRILECLDS